jgi:signal transduction histidine kinase
VIGMRERIESLGGTFHIGERPGGGTLVEAQVPIASEHREPRMASD